jgi:hypothetical protein
VIGLVIIGSLRNPDWNWKLLYRVAGKTVVEHTIALASEVEVAHKIIVCLDHKDMSQVNGTAFNAAAIDKSFLSKDERIKMYFSDKRDWIGKVYEVCAKFGLTSVAIIDADAAIMPPGLIKECIMKHMSDSVPVKTKGYPDGLDVMVLPFHTLANLYRYRDFKEKRDALLEGIAWEFIENTNEGPYFIYNEIKDLRFANKKNLSMLDAILTDIANGEDLSDLLREWNEQK